VIAEESIREVKERASITDIISESVVLKRQGRNLSGLCPFHSERSPSFNVREDDGFYHCFGCGASGNVISFVMNSRGLSFPEAVEYLAERYGIELKKDGGSRAPRATDFSREIFLANKLAADFFAHNLRQAPTVVNEYVAERSLSQEMIQTFAIGYAGKERTALVDYLLKNGVSKDRQLQAGLARRNERGEVYDTFRSRLVFPIALDSRRIAGFGGRVIPALHDAESLARVPKYLNSPESPVYEKRKTLFGLPQAVKGMREAGCVYVVEGYMDVISLAAVGVTEVVATCGTALTEEHLRRLSRLTKRVVLLFDGDNAGRQAAGRTFHTALNAEIDIYGLFLPREDDPDTIARRFGSETRSYLQGLEKTSLFDCYLAMMVREFQVERLSELGAASIEKITLEVAKALNQIKRPVLRERLTEEAAFRLRVKPETLRGAASVRSDTKTAATLPTADSSVSPSSIPVLTSLSRIDREILAAVMVLRDKVCSSIVHDALLCEALHPSVLQFVLGFREILIADQVDEATKKSTTKQLLQRFGSSWLEHWRVAHEMSIAPGANLARVFEECVRHVHGRQVTVAEIKRLELQLETIDDENERILTHQALLTLQRKLREQVSPQS
jgi:DNA primase